MLLRVIVVAVLRYIQPMTARLTETTCCFVWFPKSFSAISHCGHLISSPNNNNKNVGQSNTEPTPVRSTTGISSEHLLFITQLNSSSAGSEDEQELRENNQDSRLQWLRFLWALRLNAEKTGVRHLRFLLRPRQTEI